MVPMRGCSRGSTTSVREVPSALRLPGQSPAKAGCAAMQASKPRHKTADWRPPSAAKASPIIDTVWLSGFAGDHCTASARSGGLMLEFHTWFRFSGHRLFKPARARYHVNHEIAIVAQITQEGRQHGRGSRLGIVKQYDSFARRFEP